MNSNGDTLPKSPFRQHVFASLLIGATLLGIAAGWIGNRSLAPEAATHLAADLSIVTDAFLRLIRMIIAPLVFASLVPAIAKMSSAAQLGRIAIKSILWFLGASLLSLSLGLLMAHWLQPGATLRGTLAVPTAPVAASLGGTLGFSLADFMTLLIPRSMVEAMGGNEMLQVVVVSLLIGTAAASLQEKARGFVDIVEQFCAVMFKVTGYVMRLAPLAIFAALASSIGVHGLGIVGTYARFVGGYYLSLLILWSLLLTALTLLIGQRGLRLMADIRQLVLLVFATSSSEIALPQLLEKLVAFGISKRVAGFVLPLGYSFNMDGSMTYCTFAILFIAQAYGIPLTFGHQVALFIFLMVVTKGLTGVPRASIAVVAATLPDFQLPDSGVVLILAVDHIIDMGRSATNMVGNAVASAAVARWEGQLDAPLGGHP